MLRRDSADGVPSLVIAVIIFVAGCVLQQKIHIAAKTVSVRVAVPQCASATAPLHHSVGTDPCLCTRVYGLPRRRRC